MHMVLNYEEVITKLNWLLEYETDLVVPLYIVFVNIHFIIYQKGKVGNLYQYFLGDLKPVYYV